MRKFIFTAALLLLSAFRSGAQTDFDGVAWQDIKLDCSSINSNAHPRLFLSDKEFKDLKKQTRKGGYLGDLHKTIMSVANESLEKNDALQHTLDASGRRILHISKEAMIRIVSLSYAYRFTKDKAYLNKAAWNIETVCNFDDWNPTHFLDPSEMSFAVALGYDWLYNSLPADVRQKAAEKLRDYAMEPAAHGIGQHIFNRAGNWNQICNCCMTTSAIATYELNPDLSYEIIRRSLASNIIAAKNIYGPDGAFAEGPGYWGYGTSYQCYLMLLYETTFGSDFGLSKIKGFDRTGLYKLATCSSAPGHDFNYSDNGDSVSSSPALWYLAYKFNNPGLAAIDLQFIGTKDYKKERRLLLAIISAWKMKGAKIEPIKDRVFMSGGTTPIFIARTGWNPDDLYLGIKGVGKAAVGHSHLDAGSFVFDGWGTRWAADYYRRNYTEMENIWKQLGLEKSQYAFTQDSYRWYLLEHNNKFHNTLTVNGRDHSVEVNEQFSEYWDTPERMGAKMPMTEVFRGDLEFAERSVSIRDGSYLEVVDELAAPADKPAHIQWTFVTPVKPKISPEGITLNDGKTTMVLKTDAPGAIFKKWSADPKTYGTPTSFGEKKAKGHSFCGFEFELAPGERITVTTTLKKK